MDDVYEVIRAATEAVWRTLYLSGLGGHLCPSIRFTSRKAKGMVSIRFIELSER